MVRTIPREWSLFLTQMNRIILIVCLCAAFLPGCSKADRTSSHKVPEGQPLLIGLIPEQNIFRQFERYEPLARYLSKKIGMKIKLSVLPRYGNIISNFQSGKMDAAFFGSFVYALAHAKLGVEVLARPVGLDGRSTYHGLIFVRKDSGIKSIQDMKGKRFAFVDKAATAGYLLPLSYFHEHGIDFKTYLRESYFTGTHDDAIYDVLNKKADIGAAKDTVYERLAAADSRIKKELIILERSPDVPENGFAVRRNLDNTLKRKLKEALVGMYQDPEGIAVLKDFGAQKFIETTDTDYLPVYQYAREVHLNLATYDYLNE
jgi:phosphonate transport system substrate-binding protein